MTAFHRAISIFALIAAAGCATTQQLSAPSLPPPSILGSWTWTRPDNNCVEVYTYRADGTAKVVSGEQIVEETYVLSAAPEASGRYKLTANVLKDSHGRQCGDSRRDETGRTFVTYVKFLSDGDILKCYDPSGPRCFGPLRDIRKPPRIGHFYDQLLSGKSQVVGWWYWLGPDCSASPVEVRIVEPPKHGQLLIERGQSFPDYPQDNVRYKCNSHKVFGTLVSYRGQPGFSGDDETTVEATYISGYTSRAKYSVSVYDQFARPLSHQRPRYPDAAKARDIEGSVVAWVHIGRNGEVTDVEIKQSPDDLLSDEVTRTLRGWKFDPAIKAGKPVPIVAQYKFDFKLTGPLGDVETGSDAAPGNR